MEVDGDYGDKTPSVNANNKGKGSKAHTKKASKDEGRWAKATFPPIKMVRTRFF